MQRTYLHVMYLGLHAHGYAPCNSLATTRDPCAVKSHRGSRNGRQPQALSASALMAGADDDALEALALQDRRVWCGSLLGARWKQGRVLDVRAHLIKQGVPWHRNFINMKYFPGACLGDDLPSRFSARHALRRSLVMHVPL